MSESGGVAEQVRALRESARKARRMMLGVSNGDRQLLLDHAEELEQQATDLEQSAGHAPSPPPVVQMQVQVQQQHEAGGPVASPPASAPASPVVQEQVQQEAGPPADSDNDKPGG